MKPANEARLARLAEVHEQLTGAVAALSSSAEWQRMLRLAARFHSYSPSNVLLIGAQAPHATRVAGYRAWNSMGRQVRGGEKGIAILAPCMRRTSARDETPREPSESPAEEPPTDELGRALLGFRVVHVFDISQTDGEPFPDVAPRLLTGEGYGELWAALAAELRQDSFSVTRGHCGGANGLTDFVTREVRVRDDVEPAQAVKTLAHELGHVQADHEHRFFDRTRAIPICRGVAEVEAESIAYLLCSAAGLDTADYSFPYLAGWADGDADVLRATATRVISTAAPILERVLPMLTADRMPPVGWESLSGAHLPLEQGSLGPETQGVGSTPGR